MLQVRFWQPEDLPFLLTAAARMAWEILPAADKAAVHPELAAWSARADLLSTLLSPGGTAVVAADGGRPVGFLLVSAVPEQRMGRPAGYLADIYIAPDYRGRGLSRPLHQLGESYLRQLGLAEATHWTHAGNQAGLAAARRNGYEPWAVVMAKRL